MEKDPKIVFHKIHLTEIGQSYSVSYLQANGQMETLPTVTGSFQTIEFTDFDLRVPWYLSNKSPLDIIITTMENINLALLSDDKEIRELAQKLHRWKNEK